MRETVGNTFIIKLVVIFTFLFACFLSLAITYNKVFKLKNEVMTIVEKYEGVNDKALTVINNYLYTVGYTTKGKCPEGYKGISDYNSTTPVDVSSSEKYYYCYRELYDNDNNNIKYKKYDVVFFYRFNLPVIGDIITFKITGQTKNIRIF